MLRRLLALVSLSTRRATVVYWLSIALVIVALSVPRLLPLVDYPQHLGLAELVRRMLIPGSPDHAHFTLNLFTYNGLFHLVVGVLGFVMPIELAGRLMVIGAILLTAGSLVALLRTLERPPEYAALGIAVYFASSFGWGFVNHAVGSGLALVCLTFVARLARCPTWRDGLLLTVFAVLTAATHVLATITLCFLALALAFDAAWAYQTTWKARVQRAVIAAFPIVMAVVWCVAVFAIQYWWKPSAYSEGTIEGSGPTKLYKLVHFPAFTTGHLADETDQFLLWCTLSVMLAAAFVGRRPGDRPMLVPFVLAAVLYFVTPMVFIGTHLVFPRLGQIVIFMGLLAMPRPPEAAALRRIAWGALGLGLVSGWNLLQQCRDFARETDDLSRVFDDLPKGRALTTVLYGLGTASFRNPVLVHSAGYYAARKQGTWAFSFTRYLSLPIFMRTDSTYPSWPKRGWEFEPDAYNPRCRYARFFDLVVLRAPSSAADEAALRKKVFGEDADVPKLLSHHGEFWSFDTAGVPAANVP